MHSPQLDVIASYGTELLDWLDDPHLPGRGAPRRSASHAEATAALFLDALLAHGTTAAVVFPTVHTASVDALFAAAEARGMRLIAGKVLMDRNAPDGLRDDVASAERDMQRADRALARQGPARLCRDGALRADQHARAARAWPGRLLRADPGPLHADPPGREPRRGALGAELFPDARSYLDVYAARRPAACEERVRARHLARRRRPRRARRRRRADRALPVVEPVPRQRPVRLARRRGGGRRRQPGSDVGGGTSLSMLRTMADAYKVQALAGERLTAWKALHAATRGAAEALGLEREIG